MTLNNDALIKKDRLRYTKNKFSANLTYLAIVMNCLYFVSVYGSDVGQWYYKLLIGASVLYNLIFMLVSFLASEGVKSYKLGYGFVLIALGIGQVIRIFILPMQAHTELVNDEPVMGNGQFFYVLICLVASAALCAIAGVVAVLKTTTLRAYEAELEKRGNES